MFSCLCVNRDQTEQTTQKCVVVVGFLFPNGAFVKTFKFLCESKRPSDLCFCSLNSKTKLFFYMLINGN